MGDWPVALVTLFYFHTMTLEQIASAIRNNISSGLKGVGNYTYSLEQIKDDISATRSQLILQYDDTKKPNIVHYAQKKSNIPLEITQYPLGGYEEAAQTVLTAKIPALAATNSNSAVLYLGPPDMSLNVRVYYDSNRVNTHKYTRVIKNRPYAFIDSAMDDDGQVPVYLFNLGPSPFRSLTISAIFDDPIKLMEKEGIFSDAEEFPAPLAIQELIINEITSRYIAYYKRLHTANQSNDQTDKV